MAKKSAKPENEVSVQTPDPVVDKPAETPEKVEQVTADEINSAVEMPTPNERTIAALQKDDAQTTAAPGAVPSDNAVKPGDLDAWNRPFNPDSFHPRKAKNGTWISKGGGRKKSPGEASQASTPPPKSVVGEAGGAVPSGPGDRFDAAAEVYARAAYSITDGVMNGNGEWLPDNDGEHVAFRTALAAYLRAKGSEDLPPGAAFALAAASYAGKRVTRPNTATRIRLIGAWIRAKWQTWRNRRTLAALPTQEIKPEEKSPLPPIVDKVET